MSKKELVISNKIMYTPIKAMRELVMSDLYEFVKYFWDTFEPFPFVEADYIEFLCECFTFMSINKLPESVTSKFISDKKYEKIKKDYFKNTGVMPICDIRDKMFGGKHVRNHNINIHPRAGKSLIVNVCGPVWCMLHAPVMTTSVSHSQDLSSEFIDKKRLLLNSGKFKAMFPEDEFQLRYDSSRLVEMNNLGKSYSVSMRAFTGRGSNFILNDDLCFTGRTRVILSRGSSKCIKDLMVGDLVLSYNHSTGVYEPDPVIATRRSLSDSVTKITTNTGNTISSTSDHRYWVEDRGYTPIHSVKEGEKFREAIAFDVQDLWGSLREFSRGMQKVCGELKNTTLHTSGLRGVRKGSDKTLLGIGKGDVGERSSWNILQSEMFECESTANLLKRDNNMHSMWRDLESFGRKVLLNSVPTKLGNKRDPNRDEDMQILWERIRGIQEFYCDVLLQTVYERVSISDLCWREQPKLERWKSRITLWKKLERGKAKSIDERQIHMFTLWCKRIGEYTLRIREADSKVNFSGTPQRPRQEEPFVRQLINALQKVSSNTTRQRLLEKSIRERRCCVYDIQTLNNNNFFANGVLVHNCNVQDARADGKILQSAKDYIRYTQSTRLNDPKTGVTCHIMQRICKGDVSDMITSDPQLSKLYSNTILRALAIEDEAFILPCSGKVWFRKKGEPLAGKRFGDYTEERMKLGEIDFECQFQQNVALSGVNVVSLEDITENTITREEFEKVNKITHYASHDCPVKDKETSDNHGYVEGWSDEFGTLYIPDSFMRRMSFAKEREFMINLEKVDPSILQVIEDKANGSVLLQDLAGVLSGMIPFEPGTASKMARLELAVVYLKQGRVKFVKSERVNALCLHLQEFPTVAHDDDVDAFTQLVLTHFLQKNTFIYSGVFTNQNIVESPHDTEFPCEYYGVTEDRGMFYALKIRHDQTKDIFTVVEESKFVSVALLSDFLKSIKAGTIIYDCSVNQQVINLTQYIFGMYGFEDDNILVSTSIVKGGFAKNKIQILGSCSTSILDVMRWRSPNREFKNLPTDYDITTERVARCIRGVVTMVKGKSNFWL